MAADLEARVDLVLERGRITLEEFRAIWVDSDAILRERVAQAVMAGEVDEGAVGPMDEWGLVPFDSYIRRVVSTEVLADGRASPLAQMALVRAGGFVPSRVLYAPGPGDLWVTLGSPAGDKNPPVGTEDLPWYHWRRILEKIVNALGLGGLAGILGQLADLFTGDSMMGALMAALEAGDKKTAKILARGILEKIKKFLAEQATALGERVARVAVKLGIPGWVAGVLAVFLAGMVANAIMDLF